MHLNLPEKRYYTIGEVAKAFDVNPSLLRFWEKEFEEIQPKKKGKRNPKVHARKCIDFTVYFSFSKRKGDDHSGGKKTAKASKRREFKTSNTL
jgi:hypothetical protein